MKPVREMDIVDMNIVFFNFILRLNKMNDGEPHIAKK